MYLLFIILMKKGKLARPLRQAPCYDRLKRFRSSIWCKNLVGKELIFLQLMEWNKKMIGPLEGPNGLKAVEKECKNVTRKRRSY